MNVNPFDLSQPVVADGFHYSPVGFMEPSFCIANYPKQDGLVKKYAHSSFRPGAHYMIAHSHVFDLSLVTDLKDAESLLEKIRRDINYYRCALSSLTFSVHQEAIQILTQHIAKDECYLEQVHERIYTIKHSVR